MVYEKFTKIVYQLSQCDCAFPCINSDHKRLISAFYDQIAFFLKDVARVAVKEKKTNVKKPHWSEELSKLKRLSIEVHTVWVMHGRPHQGIINDNRLLCKSRFKKAIRQARCNFDWSVNNSMADKLVHGDYKSFMAKWHSVLSSAKVNSVNFSAYNCVADVTQELANCFEKNFYD